MKKIKILYLFSGKRDKAYREVVEGLKPKEGFWGMLQMNNTGNVVADYIEIEQVYPRFLAALIRKYVPVYFYHIAFFWKFFKYDYVFSSNAFGTQFFFEILRYFYVPCPRWVQHDFSLCSLIGEQKTLKSKMIKFLVNKSIGIVTMSKHWQTKLQKAFPDLSNRIVVIPFGASKDFFESKYSVHKNQIFSVGFDPDRDWLTLIKSTENLGMSLVLATSKERLVKITPLPEHVSYKNYTPRDLVDEYDRSLICVLPLNTSTGLNDAMGASTLFEMMMMGKAIIATRTPLTADYIVHGENGLLVNEGNVTDLREKIQLLISDEGLRKKLEQNARKTALEKLDGDVLGKQLEDFFLKLN